MSCNRKTTEMTPPKNPLIGHPINKYILIFGMEYYGSKRWVMSNVSSAEKRRAVLTKEYLPTPYIVPAQVRAQLRPPPASGSRHAPGCCDNSAPICIWNRSMPHLICTGPLRWFFCLRGCGWWGWGRPLAEQWCSAPPWAAAAAGPGRRGASGRSWCFGATWERGPAARTQSHFTDVATDWSVTALFSLCSLDNASSSHPVRLTGIKLVPDVQNPNP